MKRASHSLISRLSSSRNRARFQRFFFSELSSLPNYENPSSSSHTHVNKTSEILLLNSKPSQFQKTPSRNLNTLLEKSSQLPSIEEKFEFAVSTEDIMSSFIELESVFDKNDPKLGLACLKVGLHFEKEGNEPQKTLEFASRAFDILGISEQGSLEVATSLYLMGSACFNLKRFNDSLRFLDGANYVLDELLYQGISIENISPVLQAVQLELAKTKTTLGRRVDALVNQRQCLEIKEKILDSKSWELHVANRELAEAHVELLNFKEAFPHCLKALEISRAQLGDSSVEVAHDRRLLSAIYTGLEQDQKSLEQNLLSQRVFKKLGLHADLLRAETDSANIQITLGEYCEARDTLRNVAQQTDKESKTRALVFIAMAKLMCIQEDFADAKRCLEISYGILDKQEIQAHKEVAEAYVEMSVLYETMNEFETAIRLVKKAMSILEKLPQEHHLVGRASGRLGWLLLLTDQVEQAITSLKYAATLLKRSFGSKHFTVGYVYKNLGSAYLVQDKAKLAAEMFAVAREIMDDSLGPQHTDAIEMCQNLSETYAAIGSYTLAIEFQRRAVNRLARRGSTGQDEHIKATLVLDELKQRASEHATPKSVPVPRKCIPWERLEELFFHRNHQ